jgi:predicted anti-sigma-YlaC factor YlaD
MKCDDYQHWISDDIDGLLPDMKKTKLESHLRACSACRAYRKDLVRIQAESGREEAEPVEAGYFEKLSAALETRLWREKRVAGRVRSVALRWRWIWVSVPLVLALVLGIVFFRRGADGDGVRQEVFSFEGCLERVFQEIGGDEEMAADYTRFLSRSLFEGGEAVVLEDDVGLLDDPFFWRSLSDEDLRLIETEIKKGIRS